MWQLDIELEESSPIDISIVGVVMVMMCDISMAVGAV